MSHSSSYQLLPDLTPEEFAALKADIAERGVLVPIELDEQGNVLDGHHRVRVWTELRAEGVSVPNYPRLVRAGLSESEKRSLVRALNLTRRHLSTAERRRIVAQALAEEPERSDRRHAMALGVDHKTVGSVRSEMEARGELPHVATRTDTLGRGQPSTKASVFVGTPQAESRARAALVALGDEAPPRVLDLRAAEKLARRSAYERERAIREPLASAAGRTWELRASPFSGLELEPGSVDLVLTDPPYGADWVEGWSELGAFAARVLKPGRLLAAYCGHHVLPEAMDRLAEHLSWVWMAVILQPGAEPRMQAPRIHVGHRPVILCSVGSYVPRRWLRDTIRSLEAPDKSHHPWQQALSPARYLVEVTTRPGELVVDPCCGSGTFGVAAVTAGRRFLGADVDPVALASAKARLQIASESTGTEE